MRVRTRLALATGVTTPPPRRTPPARRDVVSVASRRLARFFEIAFDGSFGKGLAPRFDRGEGRLRDAWKAKQLAVRSGDVRGYSRGRIARVRVVGVRERHGEEHEKVARRFAVAGDLVQAPDQPPPAAAPAGIPSADVFRRRDDGFFFSRPRPRRSSLRPSRPRLRPSLLRRRRRERRAPRRKRRTRATLPQSRGETVTPPASFSHSANPYLCNKSAFPWSPNVLKSSSPTAAWRVAVRVRYPSHPASKPATAARSSSSSSSYVTGPGTRGFRRGSAGTASSAKASNSSSVVSPSSPRRRTISSSRPSSSDSSAKSSSPETPASSSPSSSSSPPTCTCSPPPRWLKRSATGTRP